MRLELQVDDEEDEGSGRRFVGCDGRVRMKKVQHDANMLWTAASGGTDSMIVVVLAIGWLDNIRGVVP